MDLYRSKKSVTVGGDVSASGRSCHWFLGGTDVTAVWHPASIEASDKLIPSTVDRVGTAFPFHLGFADEAGGQRRVDLLIGFDFGPFARDLGAELRELGARRAAALMVDRRRDREDGDRDHGVQPVLAQQRQQQARRDRDHSQPSGMSTSGTFCPLSSWALSPRNWITPARRK